jgi:crotonobetainyl-CoA:carnitine CoA-transferase CaiB-like acyl-CoA transferase
MNDSVRSPAESGEAALPLSGMRVIELTQAWAGPLCGMLLADMGAEVIKVESPGQQSEARGGFPYVGGESVIFMMTHRNKKSVTIDIKSERGRALFVDLVRTADALIQNLRPGALKKLGLDYESLKKINPRLIYTSVSGYGRTGPDAKRAGVDQVAIAATGLAATTMADAVSTPVALGTPVCDYMAAMWACHGTLCAYIARGKTGRGQQVDASLIEAGLSLMIGPTAMHFHNPTYTGYQTWINGPSEFILAGDNRYVSVFASYPALWERFVAALKEPELSDNPRFKTRDQRTKNVIELRAVLRRIFAQHPSSHWVKLLGEASVPVSLVNTIGETLADPQVEALGMVHEQDHPTAGKIRVLGVPVALSETPGRIRTPAPLLGEHTVEVLRELKVSDQTLDELRQDGVIGGAPARKAAAAAAATESAA